MGKEAPGARSQPPTVLIVEDSEDVRHVLEEVLAMEGLRVLVAAGAGDAREVARQQTIDVLVADLRLPDGHGGEVAADLEHRNPTLCTLFLSGDAPPALAARQRFLQKPARIAAILREVRGMLAARQSA